MWQVVEPNKPAVFLFSYGHFPKLSVGQLTKKKKNQKKQRKKLNHGKTKGIKNTVN